MENDDQESAPLVEDKQQFEDDLNVTIDIPTKDEDLEPGPECCIYKVPSWISTTKEEAYTPKLISIGPLHHGKQELAQMELQKLRYRKKFSERTSEKTLEEFSSYIEKNLKRICRCYNVQFVFNTKSETSKFIKMILYDAVFIIEFFLRNFKEEGSDIWISRRTFYNRLYVDLLLLENQLPFFLLEDLYNLAFVASKKPASFFHLSCSFFDVFEDEISEQRRTIKHFTDLMRSDFVSVHPENSVERFDKVYTATMLREAGVKFEAVRGANSLIDIKFDRGVLRIPVFHVTHSTDSLYRNLIAFEQCHDVEDAYFTSYVKLLDYLIDSDKDVDVLIKKEIIVNFLGSSQEVVDIFNKIMVGVGAMSLCFDKIGNDLNRYYENSWNRTMATLKHVYFNHLWRGTATVAAFIVVLLTLIQTILAIVDRAKPKN